MGFFHRAFSGLFQDAVDTKTEAVPIGSVWSDGPGRSLFRVQSTTEDGGVLVSFLVAFNKDGMASWDGEVHVSRRRLENYYTCLVCEECKQRTGETHLGTCSKSSMSTGVLPPPMVGIRDTYMRHS